MTSLADDVDGARKMIAQVNGPVLLIGQSYGGAVITEAGNQPNVAGLVSAGLPLEGVALIAGIFRIIDSGTTTLNVLGNAIAPLVIAKWERAPLVRQASASVGQST